MATLRSLAELAAYTTSADYEKRAKEIVDRKAAGEEIPFDEMCDHLDVTQEDGALIATANAIAEKVIKRHGFQ